MYVLVNWKKVCVVPAVCSDGRGQRHCTSGDMYSFGIRFSVVSFWRNFLILST
jgi:hypothetical protein